MNDTFEKRSIEKSEKVQSCSFTGWNKEKLEQIYNETYDEVME